MISNVCWIPLLYIVTLSETAADVRTLDECYGETIPVVCNPGDMVQVTEAHYRQNPRCRGAFHSNFCSRDEPSNPACVGNQTCIFNTPWIYLSPECGYSNNFLISYKCVPKSSQVNICSTKRRVLRAPSGFIISPRYPERYPGSRQCSVKILVPPHQSIHVYLLDLYLAYYNYDVTKQCVDALWIVGANNDRTDYVCSGQQRGLIFTSKSNQITIYFSSESHDYLNAKGFWIRYEAFDNPTTIAVATETLIPTTITTSTTSTSPTQPPTTPQPTSALKSFSVNTDAQTTQPNLRSLWSTSGDVIHEFAWGKSKEEDEAFTFSPTPTPTRSSIYIEYVKKELAQRLKELTEKKSLKTTPQPLIDKSKYVYDKFHTKQMLPKTTKSTGMEIDEQFIQDVHKYENPNHFIEKITQQRNQGTQPHTVIKKTHITIDEVEKHTDGNNASENIEKFIELDESETDIEGEEAYASVTTYGHTAQSKPEANVEVLNDREAEPWLPVAVSQAAVNVAKDLNKSDQPHGGIIGAAVSCAAVSIGILVVFLILWKRRNQYPGHQATSTNSSDSQSDKPFDDIILAYGSNGHEPRGPPLSNFGFDPGESPPHTLRGYPLDLNTAVNPHYNATIRSWKSLGPIDEVPELIYASAKAAQSASEEQLEKPLRRTRLRNTKSKSLDDICLKFNKKNKKRQKHDSQTKPGLSLSLESLDLESESNTDDTADLTKILYETLEDLYLETTLAQSKATIYEGLNTLRRKELKRRSGLPFDSSSHNLSFDTTVKSGRKTYTDNKHHIDTTEDSVAL